MRFKTFFFCLLFSISAAVPTVGLAAVYYVDPDHGSMNNDGSPEKPWSTLQEVFKKELIETQVYDNLPYKPGASLKPKNQGAPVKAGDTILLRSGYHGELWYRGAINSDYITIAAEKGHTPYLKRVFLSAVSKWILRGLTISPESAPTYERNTLIHVESHGWHGPSSNVIIENCTLYSVQDSSKWKADDWNKLACRGIQLNYCPNSIIRNNTLTNVDFGIVDLFGDNTLIEHNKIENLSGDGIVAGADNVTIQYNTIKNFYKVNANHDDGIQFHRGGNPDKIPMKNAVLRGNLIISHDPGIDNPLVGSPQGIGCFDSGMYINWTVENNVVLVQHYHGITIQGATDSIIINNIAFDPAGKHPAWIHLGPGGKNTVVRNNMSREFHLKGQNITSDHNLDINRYNLNVLFVDYMNNDLRHKPGSPAIDSGSSLKAPSVDRDKNPRPQGSGFDIGAYEYVPSNNEAPALRKISNKSAVENHPLASYSR